MGSTIRLGRIFGIPVGLHYSWFLVFFMVTILLADDFGPGFWGWGAALVTAILFFLSVLAHELSHSLVALARGIPVKGITLFIFGGVSQISREANRPSTELIVSVVGPLCSVALGGVFWGLHFPLEGVNADLAYMAELLGLVNVTLGVFNMLPGFPMDGGRVLRAVLWSVTRNYWTATRIATMAGQGVGLLLVGLGVAIIVLEGSLLGGWWILLGIFIGAAASASQRQFRHRENLRHRTAGDLMNPQCTSIPAGLTLGQLVQQYGKLTSSAVLLVTRAGQVMGILTSKTLSSIPRARWINTTVESVATPINQTMMASPQDDALSLLERMEERDLGQVLIISNGTLLGCVRRDHLHDFRRPRRAT